MVLKRGPRHASIEDSLYYLEFHHSGLRVQQACLRAVVQLPRVPPESHPPRTDPPVNLVRQVVRFSYGVSQIGERCCLAVLLPRGVEDYLTICVADARGINMCMVSVLLLRDGQTKCGEGLDEDCHHSLQPARRQRQDAV